MSSSNIDLLTMRNVPGFSQTLRETLPAGGVVEHSTVWPGYTPGSPSGVWESSNTHDNGQGLHTCNYIILYKSIIIIKIYLPTLISPLLLPLLIVLTVLFLPQRTLDSLHNYLQSTIVQSNKSMVTSAVYKLLPWNILVLIVYSSHGYREREGHAILTGFIAWKDDLDDSFKGKAIIGSAGHSQAAAIFLLETNLQGRG